MTTKNKPRSSPFPTSSMMQVYLRSAGIDAQKVQHKRGTGCYTAEFYAPDMQSPVKSSHDWARTIEHNISGAKIIDRTDTVAPWRSGHPVIWASVTFVVNQPFVPLTIE
jgi:hypothetical protein